MSQTELNTYITEIETWRAKRENALRAPDSWLSLAGLFHLHEGQFTVGSAESNDIILPASAPAQLGTLEFAEGKARLTMITTDAVLVDGKIMRQAAFLSNKPGNMIDFI